MTQLKVESSVISCSSAFHFEFCFILILALRQLKTTDTATEKNKTILNMNISKYSIIFHFSSLYLIFIFAAFFLFQFIIFVLCVYKFFLTYSLLNICCKWISSVSKKVEFIIFVTCSLLIILFIHIHPSLFLQQPVTFGFV